MNTSDVLVVGAGLSGLRTATLLQNAGLSVRVLEARDRVGGRTWSQPFGRGTFDLGGQWIGPTQNRVAALAASSGIQTFPTHHLGTKSMEIDGRVSTYKSDIPSLPLLGLLELQWTITRLERLGRKVDPARPEAAALAREWDGQTVESWKRAHIWRNDVRAMVDVAVRSILSAEPAELSFLYFLSYLSSSGGIDRLVRTEGGAQQDRLIGGAQGLSKALASSLQSPLEFAAPVHEVRLQTDGVVAETACGAFRARFMVMAMAPALIGRIRFSPGLPPIRDQLIQRTPMGYTIKFLVGYERAFWRERGFSGESISNNGPLVFTYDNTSHDGQQPCLVGFMVGEQARIWGERPELDRRAAVIDALVRHFGPEAARPSHYLEQNWSHEQWSAGCPVSTFTPGAMLGCGPELRTPVGRIHWAGTETATEWCGYMDGALQSGERAAAEVIEAIRRER